VKEALSKLNKLFESKLRLGIMSLLMVEEWVSYAYLKGTLSTKEQPVSDGNLASHIKKLKEQKYLLDKKEFVKNKPLTSYKASDAGKEAFEEHLTALEEIIRGIG